MQRADSQGLTILIVGAPGTGKTTLTHAYARKFLQQYPKRSIVVFDPHGTYHFDADYPLVAIPNAAEYAERENRKALKRMLDHIHDSLVIFDDVRTLFPENDPALLNTISQGKRHKRNNYILVYHTLSKVHPVMFDFMNYLYLFRTNENVARSENKLPYGVKELLEKNRKLQTGQYIKHKNF